LPRQQRCVALGAAVRVEQQPRQLLVAIQTGRHVQRAHAFGVERAGQLAQRSLAEVGAAILPIGFDEALMRLAGREDPERPGAAARGTVPGLAHAGPRLADREHQLLVHVTFPDVRAVARRQQARVVALAFAPLPQVGRHTALFAKPCGRPRC